MMRRPVDSTCGLMTKGVNAERQTGQAGAWTWDGNGTVTVQGQWGNEWGRTDPEKGSALQRHIIFDRRGSEWGWRSGCESSAGSVFRFEWVLKQRGVGSVSWGRRDVASRRDPFGPKNEAKTPAKRKVQSKYSITESLHERRHTWRTESRRLGWI